jgi:hypothetical protein
MYFLVLKFELRALHLLGSHSTTWAMPQPFFALIMFLDRVLYFLPWLASYCDPTTFTSCIAGIIGMHHHALLHKRILTKEILFLLKSAQRKIIYNLSKQLIKWNDNYNKKVTEPKTSKNLRYRKAIMGNFKIVVQKIYDSIDFKN